MEMQDCMDLLTLQRQVKEGLEELFPRSCWVSAEVSSIQVRTNGHCYLDLSQTDQSGKLVAKVKAVIWKGKYYPLAFYYREATGSDIQPGQQIKVLAQVNYSELYGLSLVIDEIEPEYTLGAAEIEKQKTIEKLKADNLLDAQKELAVPDLPYHLAVISASDAAGYGDFCRHLTRNEYGFVFDVELFEATMQGAGAPESIIDALERIEASDKGNPVDAVLILRGGGSALDLACFDDYSMCFAIASCPIPVFTAIGHDRDYHVADMVSHCFVKTPTALADEFIACFASEDERISAYSRRLSLAFSSKISVMESRLEVLGSRIKAADPRNILSRGYSLVTDAKGVVVKSIKGISSGDSLGVLFEDGKLEVIVK